MYISSPCRAGRGAELFRSAFPFLCIEKPFIEVGERQAYAVDKKASPIVEDVPYLSNALKKVFTGT